MLAVGALSVGRATVRTLASLGTARRDWNVAERLLGSAWFVVGLTMFAQVGLVPINETDSLSYHMPAMAQWYQSHAFVMPGGVTAAVTRYPYDWEALCALFLLPFGDDFLVASPNVLAWLVFGLSIPIRFRLCSCTRARRSRRKAAPISRFRKWMCQSISSNGKFFSPSGTK